MQDNTHSAGKTNLPRPQLSDTLSLHAAADQALKQGIPQQAEIYWKKALTINPRFVPAYFCLGNLYRDQKRFEEAGSCYRSALFHEANSAEIHNNFATLLHEINRPREAEEHFRLALELQPQSPFIHNNFGAFLKQQSRYSEAEHHYKDALGYDPTYAVALSNLGILYSETEQYLESEKCYQKALSLTPNSADIRINLGGLYYKTQRYSEAEKYYRESLTISPYNPKAMYFLATLLLIQGRLEEGWQLYETPFRYAQNIDKAIVFAPILPFPQWKGESLMNKSLVIWQEQGFGDIIQFSRYVYVLKQQGARHITYVCKPSLQSLFQTLKGVDKVICLDDAHIHSPTGHTLVDAHDYWTLALSIPLYMKTTLSTIPSATGTLSVPADREKKWRSRIPASRVNVGLIWKSSLIGNKEKKSFNHLEQLRTLWSIPTINFISLQKGQGEEEALHCSSEYPLLDLGSEIDDFADAAAILQSLDLLITVDTAYAHLAGALDKEVWLLLPYQADWRWLLDREDSPWYPGIRLFRQTQRLNWGSVITRVTQQLGQWVRQRECR